MAALEDRYSRQQRTLQARLRRSLETLYRATLGGYVRSVPIGSIALNDESHGEPLEHVVRLKMESFDDTPPIHLNLRGELLDGRHRLEAATRLGRPTIQAAFMADNLDTAFPTFMDRAEPIIRSAQSAGVTLSTAYLSALILRDGRRTARLPVRTDLVGTSQIGTLREGMDAWPSMVKAEIGKGRPRPEAIAFGAYLATRFADSETKRAMDEQTEHATRESKQFRGWFGLLAPPSCPECVAHNTGFHGLDEPMFRHGGCDCSKQYVAV